MKVSVCIPSYDENGNNLNLIKDCLDSCLIQDYDDFEIIISDHSSNNNVFDLVTGINSDKITYLKYEENLGKPAFNTNNAILNSRGDLIKIMNQDDYFLNSTVLTKMVKKTKQDNWSIISFIHLDEDSKSFYNPMVPKLMTDGTHLLRGVNTIGCPSVGLFPKGNLFDTNVVYMIDCELWYKLFKKYGEPFIIDEQGIVIRTGNHNLTSKLQNQSIELINKDTKYLIEKYKL